MVGGETDYVEVEQEYACKDIMEKLNNIDVQETSAKTLLHVIDLLLEKGSHKFLKNDYLESTFK